MAAARFPSASDITTREFHAATDSEVNTAAWCKRFGLLATHKTCPVCAQPMVWSLRADRGTAFRWRCCRPCTATVTIRVDTFFDKSNLRIRTILDLIRCWAYEELSFKKAQREFAISEHTFVNWRNFMRDICAEYFMQNPMMIGGPGVVVQIDESMFVRRKHNVGRPVGVQWVFGGIDCNTKEGFLVSVPRRDAATLIPILTRYVRRGTTVVSDLWRAYNMVGANGYNHLTVNHSLHFVDPVTGAHTNEVENMWMLAKRRNKKECGTARSLIDTYLVEFMWRLKFGQDPFESILRNIRAVYPQ